MDSAEKNHSELSFVSRFCFNSALQTTKKKTKCYSEKMTRTNLNTLFSSQAGAG